MEAMWRDKEREEVTWDNLSDEPAPKLPQINTKSGGNSQSYERSSTTNSHVPAVAGLMWTRPVALGTRTVAIWTHTVALWTRTVALGTRTVALGTRCGRDADKVALRLLQRERPLLCSSRYHHAGAQNYCLQPHRRKAGHVGF